MYAHCSISDASQLHSTELQRQYSVALGCRGSDKTMRNRTAPEEKAGRTRAEPIPSASASETTTAVGCNTAAAQRKANRKRGLQKVRSGEQGKKPSWLVGRIHVTSHTRIARGEHSLSVHQLLTCGLRRGDRRQVLAVVFLPCYLAWRWFDPRRSTAPDNPCEEATPLVQLQPNFLRADHFDRLVHHVDHHWRLTNRCACAVGPPRTLPSPCAVSLSQNPYCLSVALTAA
jgi:hypothetical protein